MDVSENITTEVCHSTNTVNGGTWSASTVTFTFVGSTCSVTAGTNYAITLETSSVGAADILITYEDVSTITGWWGWWANDKSKTSSFGTYDVHMKVYTE
jgi:hypothetical protein